MTTASVDRIETLAQLRAAVMARGQYEFSDDITPTLLTDFINEAIAELWDLLVGKWQDYYTISTTFPFVIGTDTYALPSGFYKLRKLERQASPGPPATWDRMEPHDLAIAHEFRSASSRHYRYRIQAGNLVFVTLPNTVETIRIYYVPVAPLLVADDDSIAAINGYEELCLQLALKRCKDREDLDTSGIEREIARLTLRIRTAADARDATEPYYLNARRGRRRGRRGLGCEDD